MALYFCLISKYMKKQSILHIIITILLLVIVLSFFMGRYKKQFFELFENKSNKYACIYAYYEKNDLYKNNFTYFLNNAILPNIDYYIIINGTCSIDIPKKENIKVFFRENKGYDFGAYSYMITNHVSPNDYDYYIFLNATVIGPYMKKYDNYENWLDLFLSLFKNDVAIVGTSICFTYSAEFKKYFPELKSTYYVQSQFFICKKEFMKELVLNSFFSDEEKLNNCSDLTEVVVTKEIKMSVLALKNGWNINCLLEKYQGLDYRTLDKDINPMSNYGDPYWENKYFGKTIQKEDVCFYKNKRFLQDKL